MDFVVLDEHAFTPEYHKAFQQVVLDTDEAREEFRDRVFIVRAAVENALLKKWKDPDDFEIGWNFNYWFHTYGGVYSERVFCPELVTTIRDALASVDREGNWTHHMVCEIVVNPKGRTAAESMELRGEFFVRGGKFYINGSEMRREWRERLGCLD